MKKRNKFKNVKEHGYQITIDGHTMFPEDICKKLDRLNYVEELLLKYYSLAKEIGSFIDKSCFVSDTTNYGDCYLQKCVMCGEMAWANEDIKHKKQCIVGIILKEIKAAAVFN